MTTDYRLSSQGGAFTKTQRLLLFEKALGLAAGQADLAMHRRFEARECLEEYLASIAYSLIALAEAVDRISTGASDDD